MGNKIHADFCEHWQGVCVYSLWVQKNAEIYYMKLEEVCIMALGDGRLCNILMSIQHENNTVVALEQTFMTH
jgi:hypothetical protein